MNKRWRAIGLLAGVAALLGLVPVMASAQATTSTWRANLTGANEVPPVTTDATGTFTATLDEAAGTLTWTLSATGLQNITAAHLHTGAAGANGGVVMPLFAPPGGQVTNILNISNTSRQSDLSGSLAGNFAGFVTQLKAGTIYVNVHTTQNPGGAIRAQVASTQATATATAKATATATAAPTATATAAPKTTATAAPTAAPTTAATAAPKATTGPAAPKTGGAGLADNSNLGVVILLAALAVGTVTATRLRMRAARK
jgi:hypothetical protein